MSAVFAIRRHLAVVVALAFAFLVLFASSARGSVYWADQSGSTIGRANLDGSGVVRSFLTLPGGPHVRGLALDGDSLLWSHGNWPDGAIGRIGRDGANPDPQFLPTTGTPTGLSIDDAHVYWANGSNGVPAFGGSIGRALRDGTARNDSFIQGAAWTVGDIAVDHAHVYWANGSGHSAIGRANLDGTGVNPSFAFTEFPLGVAVDNTYVYWTERDGITRARLDGSDVTQNFISTGAAPYGLAINAHHIYWAATSAIGRANLDGTDVQPQWISGLYNVRSIAVDGRSATTTSLTASPASAIYGQDHALTARVATPGGTPAGGSVVFTVTDEPTVIVPLAPDGTAEYQPPYLLNVGDAVTARYSGDAHSEPSRAHLAVDLRPARTALAVSIAPNPVTVGTPVTLTVAATNLDTSVVPFGAVQVAIDNEWIADEPLDDSGQASGTLVPSDRGDYRITVKYYDDTGAPADFIESEQTVIVHVVAPGTAATTPKPTTPAVTLNPPAATTRAALIAMIKPLLRSLHRHGLRALSTVAETLTVRAPGTLSQLLYSSAKPATDAAKTKPVLLAQATHRFTRAGRGVLRLRMTAAGRRLARKPATLRLQIVTRFTPTAGTSLRVRSRLTVKARGRR